MKWIDWFNTYWKFNFPMTLLSACCFVWWLLGPSVCHNFLKGRKVTLPCSYRSIGSVECDLIHIYSEAAHLLRFFFFCFTYILQILISHNYFPLEDNKPISPRGDYFRWVWFFLFLGFSWSVFRQTLKNP